MHIQKQPYDNAGRFVPNETFPVRAKITILGAGHVGSHVAQALASANVCDEIVLVDKLEGKAAAQAMDIADAQSFFPSEIIIRAGDYADCADSQICIVCIGKPIEPGQTRLDLLEDSVRMARELSGQLGSAGIPGLLISITNPCDIIADVLRQLLKLDRFRAFGTGTLLDTARLARTLSEQTGVPRHSIEACSMGEHGDSSMIPFSALRINGRPAGESAGFDAAAALFSTRNIGMDIIKDKGSTEFGIGRATAFLCEAILSDSKRTLPLSVHLEGEYGISGINCGVPCVIGREGIERIIELPLDPGEQKELLASAAVLEKYTQLAREML